MLAVEKRLLEWHMVVHYRYYMNYAELSGRQLREETAIGDLPKGIS